MSKVKSILIICPYPVGCAASQRLKYEQYFSHWKEAGFQLEISSFFDKDSWKVLYANKNLTVKILGTLKGYLKRIKDIHRAKDFEVVYVCMWVAPFLDWFFEWLLRRNSSRLVFDFDDSIHSEIDPFIDKFYKRLFKGRKKVRYLIKNSDHVITSSPFNLDFCQNLNLHNNSSYIPCTLDTERFVPVNRKIPQEKITLGWTGTFTTKTYIDSIKPTLIECCQENNLKLILITNFEYVIEDIDLEVIPWKKETEIFDLQKIDIGIYPLIQTKWALGKGALKTLQYMSIGIPSISTNFGTATKIINHGVDGFLASNESDWKKYINMLANDEQLRKVIGNEARKKAVSSYSVAANKEKYINILNGK